MNLTHQHNFHPIIIKGDSQILINMVSQIQQGSMTSRVAKRWRLMARLELIEKWMKNRRATTFTHVKGEKNKVEDLLANIGVEHDQVLHSGTINILNDQTQIQDCTDMVHKEAQLSDAGEHHS